MVFPISGAFPLLAPQIANLPFVPVPRKDSAYIPPATPMVPRKTVAGASLPKKAPPNSIPLFIAVAIVAFIFRQRVAGGLALLLGLADCGGEETHPCAGIDCGGFGECLADAAGAIQCVCDEGYVNKRNDLCVPQGEEKNPCERVCLDGRSLQFCLPDGTPDIERCGPGRTCSVDSCQTVPEAPDPNCTGFSQMSECWITDQFNVIEGSDHAFDSAEGIYSNVSRDTCVEDDAFHVGSSSYNDWFAHTLTIALPGDASYYGFDAMMNWKESPSLMGVRVLFGDGQTADFIPDSPLRPCALERLGNFSTSGINPGSVRIGIENRRRFVDPPEDYEPSANWIDFARTRIWSCKCEDEVGPL